MWTEVPYEQLAARVRAVAGSLKSGDVVVVLAETPVDVTTAFFGALYAGAVPAVLPTPRMFEPVGSYADRLTSMTEAVGEMTVLATAETVGVARKIARPGCDVMVLDDLLGSDGCDEPHNARPEDSCMIQFTSGSSGPQRGVVLTRAGLQHHLGALRSWLVADPEVDVSISWLPTHHDMGLVGLVLLPIVHQAEACLLSPDEFVQNPLVWLEAIARFGATVSACPPFGLDHCVRAIDRRGAPEVDLRSMRCLVVGAERVTAGPLERFVERTAPLGFDSSAILPAYGLAEATLGVTGTFPGRRPTKVAVRPDSVIVGRHVVVTATAPLFATTGEADWLVGSGSPLPGADVDVRSDDSTACAEGVVGHVFVRSPSLAAGFVGSEGTSGDELIRDGWLDTGDTGFLRGGELFVFGRRGDALKVRGRAIFAESLEARVREIARGPRRLVVVLGSLAGRDVAAIMFEGTTLERWEHQVRRLLKAELQGVEIELVLARVPRGTIEFTSSGKPRRRSLWDRLEREEIDMERRSLD